MTNSQTPTTDRIAPDHVEAPIGTVEFHLDVLDDLTFDADSVGAVPLASDPENRYPYAYPRDIGSITRAWLIALERGYRPEQCRRRIVDAARFLTDVQDDGWWYQRYALDGGDRSIYQQEDNVAHGIRVLAHAVFALDARDELASERVLLDDIVEAFDAALTVLREELYDPNAHLVESTTSIHEGAIESGYTLWVNCTVIAALRQARDALTVLPSGDDVDERVDELLGLLEAGVERSFAVDGRVVPRRYGPNGNRDERPDITLIAPAYYELDDLFGDHVARAANRAAASLEDPRLGGLQRFRGFYRDHDVHQHGGNGPWMQYTAWYAQFCFESDEVARGDDVLTTITEHADAAGHIPEHLSTRERFEQFVEQEWDTGLDYEKEFDDNVLRDVPFDRVVEELGHMQAAYDEMATALEDSEVISFAEPLTWCHAEFMVALLRREDATEH